MCVGIIKWVWASLNGCGHHKMGLGIIKWEHWRRKNVKIETEEGTHIFSMKNYLCLTKGEASRKLVAVGHTATLKAHSGTHVAHLSCRLAGRWIWLMPSLSTKLFVSCADFRSQYHVCRWIQTLTLNNEMFFGKLRVNGWIEILSVVRFLIFLTSAANFIFLMDGANTSTYTC